MGIKEQLLKIKENWLLLLVILVFMVFLMSGQNLIGGISQMSYGLTESAIYRGDYGEEIAYSKGIPMPSEDFAPEVEDRKIVHTSRITNEIERGRFFEEEAKLKNIATAAEAYILSQNVNKYETGIKSYYTGYYQIKVDTTKYDSVVAQLKEIGEVKSFNEDQTDVTARYVDTEIEINVEKERLKRYKAMYEEATEVADKITLSDRIYTQERRIKYLEDTLENLEQRISYSTIYITLNEKRSEYANVVFVKISEIVKSTVGSVNSLVKLFFVLLPWALAVLIISFVIKAVRKRV